MRIRAGLVAAVLLLALVGASRGAAEGAPPAPAGVERVGRAGEAAEPPAAAGPNHLFMPLVTGGGTCPDFFDDFSATTGWFTGDRDGLLAEVRDGEYRLLVTRPGFVWLVGAPDCARAGARVAVAARWQGTPGNFYGLLLAEDDRLDRAHVLAVNSDARVWLLMRVHGDALDILIGPIHHDAIHAGAATNRLAMTRAGERLILSINGVVVGETADPAPAAPLIAGLVAASYTGQSPADARFDDFTHRGENSTQMDADFADWR